MFHHILTPGLARLLGRLLFNQRGRRRQAAQSLRIDGGTTAATIHQPPKEGAGLPQLRDEGSVSAPRLHL